MTSLTALADCLAQALHDVSAVPAEILSLSEASGHVLAEGLAFPAGMPPVAEALRTGFAVSALDLVGASASVPVWIGTPDRVLPGDPLPPGTDAVLPEDGVEGAATGLEAVRPVGPGEGVRRTGHDGRAGTRFVAAGLRLHARHCLAAGLAGVERCAVRRPRTAIRLPDPRHAAFAAACMTSVGARLSDAAPHLILRASDDPRPRLALAPAETAWLGREGGALVLEVPQRFDGMVAACLGLGLPAMAVLGGAEPMVEERPLIRKVASSLGVSDLVLLAAEGSAWRPAPPGSVTLVVLAVARAYAILGPESEGLAEGATLAGTSLDWPFG